MNMARYAAAGVGVDARRQRDGQLDDDNADAAAGDDDAAGGDAAAASAYGLPASSGVAAPPLAPHVYGIADAVYREVCRLVHRHATFNMRSSDAARCGFGRRVSRARFAFKDWLLLPFPRELR